MSFIDSWASGSLSCAAMEPLVSTRKTRCAGLRSLLETLRPCRPTLMRWRPGVKGEGAPSRSTRKAPESGWG